jgi:hypothetical protein
MIKETLRELGYITLGIYGPLVILTVWATISAPLWVCYGVGMAVQKLSRSILLAVRRFADRAMTKLL